MGNFPYKTQFNEIATEERDHGNPVVTFLVKGVHGLPESNRFSAMHGLGWAVTRFEA
jgi:hypothetical protein